MPPAPSAWFEYPIRVQPHHTDYAGVVWHGTYVTWLESARIECLRAVGIPFEQLVSLGYDLPVVALDLRYRQPLTLGTSAIVKTRLAPMTGIRLSWLYEIETVGPQPQLCLTGQVTLVTVSMRDRKVVRRLPAEVAAMIAQIADYFEEPAIAPVEKAP
ncbi:MAG: acyl-CoA thioesterase [Phormidesmis sp.]